MTSISQARKFTVITFVLMAPYLAFAVYFMVTFPPDHVPLWFSDTLLAWLVVNVGVLTYVAKRMFARQEAVETEGASGGRTKVGRTAWIVRIVGCYLITVWSVLFVVGIKETIDGKYSLSRAFPAGVFLLFFISIFSWGVYRTFRRNT